MGSSVVLATAGYDHTIRCAMGSIWTLRFIHTLGGGRLTAPLTPHLCPIWTFPPRFWEATSGICYRTLQFPDSQVNKLEITADKTLIAAAGNPHVRLFSVASANPQPVLSFDQHSANVTAVGFQKDGKWMYTGSEDGTVRIWDMRAPGCQREYESRAAVNTVVLHPQQGELISGGSRLVMGVGRGRVSCGVGSFQRGGNRVESGAACI